MSNDTEQAAAPAAETETSKALKLVHSNIAEFDSVEAGLQALDTKYKNVVYDVASTQGLVEAKQARAAIREPRYAVQHAIDNAKRPLETLKKAITRRGEEIIERIRVLENPIDKQIKNREEEIEAKKEEERKREADAARIAAEKIQAMQDAVMAAVNQTVEVIDQKLAYVEAVEVTLDVFGERTGEAEQTRAKGITTLKEMRVQREAFDQQQADLLRQQEAQRERDEADRLAREQREADEQRQANERRETQEREDRERRERLDREEAELNERRQKLEDEEKAARAKREEKEAAERAERQRIEDEARLQREKEEREATEKEEAKRREVQARRENAEQELQGLRHQAMIAFTGRSPYYKGGLAEEMPKLIAETKAWALDNFPADMRERAEKVKAEVLEELEATHKHFIERDARAALELAEKKQRDASGTMLAALRKVKKIIGTDNPTVWNVCAEAIYEATGNNE